MNVFKSIVYILAFGLVSLGCDNSVVNSMEDLPGQQSIRAENVEVEFPETDLDKLAEITRKVPGFAGFYMESQDKSIQPEEVKDLETAKRYMNSLVPVVLTTNENISANDKSVLHEELAKIYRMDVATQNTSSFTVKQVKYDFNQLYDWMKRIPSHQSLIGLRIAEENNQFEIVLDHGGPKEEITENMLQKGVPHDAFQITVEEINHPDIESIYSMGSLSVTQRPLVGGLKIQKGGADPGGCSLGFIAFLNKVPFVPGPYAVTNTHCSAIDATLDSGTQFQTFAQLIGNEALDPPFFSLGSLGNGRLTDASLYLLTSSIISNGDYENEVAYPSSDGSTIYNATLPIVSEGVPPKYSPIMMVGKTSGRQVGIVWDTCDITKGTDGWWRVCSIRSSYSSTGGDSGAPVFWFTDSAYDKIRLYGIHWGGNSKASRIDLIEDEIGGTLTTTF